KGRSGPGPRRASGRPETGEAAMTRTWVKQRWAWLIPGGMTLVALMLGGCMGGGAVPGNMPMQNVGTWQIGVANNPDPPRVGDNAMTVVVRDSSGKPMQGSVEAVVSMPQMGSMPYMESRGKVRARGSGVFLAS